LSHQRPDPTWPSNVTELASQFFDAVKLVQESESYDETPLLGAAERGHKAVVQQLLEQADVSDSEDCKGQTPLLRWRARGSDAAAARERSRPELQGHGKVHKRTDAAVAGRGVWARGVMRLLLEKGADVDSKQRDLVARDAEPCHAGRQALSRVCLSPHLAWLVLMKLFS
jgi:hypothetical protein